MKVTNQFLKGLKEKKPRKGGKERRFECPRCGAGKTNDAPLEVNADTGLARCFRCEFTFCVTDMGDIERRAIEQFQTYRSEGDPVGDLPDSLERIFKERKCDMHLTAYRYRVGWDGYRICWPVGKGYWRRAIFSAQRPKVLCDPDTDGLLGEHLLVPRKSWAVLCEGDWGAASIPNPPFVGVASGGHTLTTTQLETFRYYKPKIVVGAWDGGVDMDQVKFDLMKYSIGLVRIELPKGKGPDDILKHELVDKLLEVTVE